MDGGAADSSLTILLATSRSSLNKFFKIERIWAFADGGVNIRNTMRSGRNLDLSILSYQFNFVCFLYI